MKKLIAEAPNKVVLADVDIPQIKPNEVLVKSVRFAHRRLRLTVHFVHQRLSPISNRSETERSETFGLWFVPGSELNRVRRLPGDADSKWPNYIPIISFDLSAVLGTGRSNFSFLKKR